MSDEESFESLIRAVRGGDADAAARLVKQYERELRTIARVKLGDTRLRRVVDSMDICQSVLGKFFFLASAGEFDLKTPKQLLALLQSMIKGKAIDKVRYLRADVRDQRRVDNLDLHEQPLVAVQDTPSQIASARELAEIARRRLTPDERVLVDLRTNGREWEEIAAELGGSPDALRKKYKRALDRVAGEIGLD